MKTEDQIKAYLEMLNVKIAKRADLIMGHNEFISKAEAGLLNSSEEMVETYKQKKDHLVKMQKSDKHTCTVLRWVLGIDKVLAV